MCNWFNEYARFGERDQLSFAYVLYVQRANVHTRWIPRRYHWSATIEEDTARCYNASATDVSQLALRFQHGTPVRLAVRSGSRIRRPTRGTGLGNLRTLKLA